VKKTVIFVFLIFVSALCPLLGQSLERHAKELIINADTIVLDTHSLVLGSVVIEGISPQEFQIDYLNATLIIKNQSLKGKSVHIIYRTYPLKISEPTVNRPLSVIEKRLYAPVNPLSVVESVSPLKDIFNDASLATYGSLSRGILVGNAQDMSVNSNLNLQLSGKLDENIEILANITDQNIPIQTEGNSARLKDFDKIFISLKYKDLATITAGDILSQSQGTYFMKYNKQGIGLMGDVKFKTQDSNFRSTAWRVYAGGTMAKGNFKSQKIVPQEGNQGPYKLLGDNNELYITVLAGSEKVYIDAVLLKRGEDADYVIDYNTAEVTFTARQPISKDKRIVVEFEYSDQNYAKMLFTAGTEMQQKKWTVGFHFYHEQDLKNQPVDLELTDAQRNFLAKAGNQTENSYMLNLDSSAFEQGEIRYKMVDTTVAGVHYDSVFVYSNQPDSAFYQLGFTLVGDGKGDYILANGQANGRVFVWIAPQNGSHQGNYAPVSFIPAPQRTQMYALNVVYQPFKNTFLSVNSALSNNDLNTFSSIDDAHNVGFAVKTLLESTLDLRKKKEQMPSDWQLQLKGFYEVKNANFRAIEDYRNIEFTRDYNLTDSMRTQNEHFAGLEIGFVEQNKGKISISSNALFVPQYNYLSARSNFFTDFQTRGYHVFTDVNLLNNKQLYYKTLFLQAKGSFSKIVSVLEVGMADNLELNLYRTLTDTLMSESFASNEASFFFKSRDSLSKKVKYGLSYTNRIDGLPNDNTLLINSIAHQVTANTEIIRFLNHQLRLNAAYRYLSYNDSVGEKTLLVSTDYQGNFCKSAIQVGVFYEIGSGLEQKNEYSYLRVTDGKGVYQWIDYNGNGVEELDEFEVAVYADNAKYVRVWMLSNQYIKTLNNKFTASLSLRPANAWNNKKGFRKFLSYFSNLTTFQSQLKNTDKSIAAALNPFYGNVDDTSLVLINSTFRNAFSFRHSVFSGSVIYSQNSNKTLNTSGFERSQYSNWLLTAQCNIKKMFVLRTEYHNGLKIRAYEYLNNRDYKINIHDIKGSVAFEHKNSLKITLLYQYWQKFNQLGKENANSHIAGIEWNFNMVKRGNLLFKAEYHYIRFTGETNTSVAYEMLESLTPGHNGIFNLIFQTTIWQNLQLNLSYEGRLQENLHVKHLAGIEMRAFF
jgi:hypothetical protein